MDQKRQIMANENGVISVRVFCSGYRSMPANSSDRNVAESTAGQYTGGFASETQTHPSSSLVTSYIVLFLECL